LIIQHGHEGFNQRADLLARHSNKYQKISAINASRS
jgi:hypothetical protein